MRLFSIVLLGTWLCTQLTATARYRYCHPLSSTRHSMTKSFLRPLRAEFRSTELSSSEEHTGSSQSPPIEGSSEVKYNKRRRLMPLPIEIVSSLPIPPPTPELSTSTSTSDDAPDAVKIRRSGNQRQTTAGFIARAVEVHGDKYDYSLTEYGQNSAARVTIICKNHDPHITFELSPDRHLRGNGCSKCVIARLTRTTAGFIAEAVEVHGDNRFDYSLTEYIRSGDKVKIICPRHDPPITFEQTANRHLAGSGCPACGFARAADKARGNTSLFIARAVEKHGDRYNYSLSVFGKTSKDKVKIICEEHKPHFIFEQRPDSHTKGSGCPQCALNNAVGWRPRSSTEKFIARAVSKHGEGRYDYSLTEYVRALDKVVIICPKHDPPFVFEQTPSSHLGGQGLGCSICARKNSGDKLRSTTAAFIARSVEVHGDRYNYSLSVYGKNKTDKLKIICPRHDPPITFEMGPSNHLRGEGCTVCGVDGQRGNTADFIARAVEIHGDKYNYSLSVYGKTTYDKVKIICKNHDPPAIFEQRPIIHLTGSGCPACSNKKIGVRTPGFIARAVEVHGDKYDYSLVKYEGRVRDSVMIQCMNHDTPFVFKMRAGVHFDGAGCPYCEEAKKDLDSAIEWLEHVAAQSNPPISIKHALNGGKHFISSTGFHVDGYCGETNTVYEYRGSYTHGDPAVYKSTNMHRYFRLNFGVLFKRTVIRDDNIKSLGYNLVVMWESEWSAVKSAHVTPGVEQ